MRIAILGFAREGKSLLKFLAKHPRFRGAEIWVLDKDGGTKVPSGVKRQTGKRYLANLEKFDLVFRSPGIPYNSPEIRKARTKGVKFSSLTRIFFESAGRRTTNIIGVTGTKGKGTTSTLTYKILKAAHRPVVLAGNIGKPALEILHRLKKNSLVILELSSFQLQDLPLSPHIAVVLDIFPDHQDAHADLQEYYSAKANIARFQKATDKIFFFSRNTLSRRIAQRSRGQKIAVDEKRFSLFSPSDLKIRGAHNFKNAVMAATITRALGVPRKTILRVVENFSGIEHRLELVKKISAIYFYNDSASTNPQTSAAATRAFPAGANILIAGGQDKGLDYKPLAQALKNSNTSLVVLFGESKKKIEKALKDSRVPLELASNLRRAIQLAYQTAKKIKGAQVHIIFSPGAASFDMFRNYVDRGEKFKLEVRKLTNLRK